MKWRRVSFAWLTDHSVPHNAIRLVEPTQFCWIDGRLYKRIKRRYKNWPVITGFGEPNGQKLS